MSFSLNFLNSSTSILDALETVFHCISKANSFANCKYSLYVYTFTSDFNFLEVYFTKMALKTNRIQPNANRINIYSTHFPLIFYNYFICNIFNIIISHTNLFIILFNLKNEYVLLIQKTPTTYIVGV